MKKKVTIGIIGDFDGAKTSHPATNDAIRHAARRLSLGFDVIWIPTPSLMTDEGLNKLAQFDGLWAASGSPYDNTQGALRGIRKAREMDKPFFGT